MPAQTSDWVDAKQFEDIYPFAKRTFFDWIAKGKLTAYRPSKRKTLVKRSDIDRLLEASRAENHIDRIVDEVLMGVGCVHEK